MTSLESAILHSSPSSILSACLAILLLCGLIFAGLNHSLWWQSKAKTNIVSPSAEKITTTDVYDEIAPWPESAAWQTVEPLKIRPFKANYHLTMALEKMTFCELVAVDKTYLERIMLRRQIMRDHPEATIACNTVCEPAISELHQWMFGTYLPRRLPGIFQKLPTTAYDDQQVKNLVTNETISVNDQPSLTALHNISSHVDTDFLLLLPSSTAADGQPIYHLEAYVTCFPSGFSTRSKLGLPLAQIHTPVPGYAAKLERSMDRYFAKVPVGSIVKRANWTITTTDDLFVEAGTHLRAGEEQNIEQQRKEIVLGNCRLRTERQTLHRLPKTGALVFAFKTYQYTLDDIKAEGSGPALIAAIDGLATGSLPEMHHYKRAVIWGDVIKSYLSS